MFENIVNAISLYAIPFIIVSIVLFGAFKKVNVYETFTDGAKDGFKTAVTIIPFLVGMLVAIGVFRASGALDLITNALSPITSKIGAVGIKKTRHALPAGLIADVVGIITAVVVTNIMF